VLRRKEGHGELLLNKLVGIAGILTAHNKAYALHSLAVVRAAPNRGGGAAATSHKQNVTRNSEQI